MRKLRQVGPITALTLIELFLEGEFKLTQDELDELIGIVSSCLERINNSRGEDEDDDDPV